MKQIKKGYSPPRGTGFVRPNFLDLGKSFGIPAWSVDSEEALRDALTVAMNSNDGLPKLIEAKMDCSPYPRQFDAVREL